MFSERTPISKQEANQILKMDAGKNGKKHCRVHTETAEDNLARRRALDKDFGICSDCINIRITRIYQDGQPRVELRCIEGESPVGLHRVSKGSLWGLKPRCTHHSESNKIQNQ